MKDFIKTKSEGLINTISYKEYFDLASNLSKSNRWLTASGPPISIEFDRDLDHSSLDKTSNQVDKNGVPILGSHFRPLVGDNLDDIYTDLKRTLLERQLISLKFIPEPI